MTKQPRASRALAGAPGRSDVGAIAGYTTYRNRAASLFIDDPLLQEFRGRNAERTIDKMLLDPIVAGSVERTALTLRSAPWNVEPPPDNPTDLEKRFADRLAQDLDELETGWASTVAQMADAIAWGFSLFEVLYRQDADGYHWADFSPREQRSIDHWNIDPNTGALLGVRQRIPVMSGRSWPAGPSAFRGLIDIPGWKLLHFRTHPASGQPYGRALIRNAFIGWTDKQELRRITKVGLRRDLTGVAKYEVPAELLSKGATPEQKAALTQAVALVQEFERDQREGLVLPSSTIPGGTAPSGYKFELVQSGGRRQLELGELWTIHNREIAIGLLAEFALLGHEQVGTQALAGTKVSFFERAVNSWLDSVSETMQKKVVRTYQAFNPQFAEARVPRLTHGDVDKRSLAEIGTYIQSVLGALTPEQGLEVWLRRQIGAPDVLVDAPLDPGGADTGQEEQQPGDKTPGDQSKPDDADATGEQHELT